MSRSYKKNPYVTDHHRRTTKERKQIANRKTRRNLKNTDELPACSFHKKFTQSWNICDYKWRMTRQEAIIWYETQASDYIKRRYPTLDKWLNYWEKCHVRK